MKSFKIRQRQTLEKGRCVPLSKATYFGFVDENAIGVLNKIEDLCCALEKEGWRVNRMVSEGGWRQHFRTAALLMRCRREIIFFRCTFAWMLLQIPSMSVAKLKGCKLVLDVPTPTHCLLAELKNRRRRWLKIAPFVFSTYATMPLTFWLSDLILVYSKERMPFSWLGKRKMLDIGNWVALDRVPMRSSTPDWPTKKVVLMGVANVKRWHGYDRIIKALSICATNRGMEDLAFEFYIVGESPLVGELRALASDLGVSAKVHFVGRKKGAELMDIYERAHLAVGAIGLHRIGLYSASSLKAREYCAVGIPFIGSASDKDFERYSAGFHFKVSSDESVGDIVRVLDEFRRLRALPDQFSIRKFAEKHLDVKQKVLLVLENLPD